MTIFVYIILGNLFGNIMKNRNYNHNRILNCRAVTIVCLIFLMLCQPFLTGCIEKKTEIILTTEFKDGEVFRLEDLSCYLPEIMVYLVNSENKYDEIFGENIWDVPIVTVTLSNTTVGEAYKETILARIAQIKVMNLLARDYGITLDDEEKDKTAKAADEYFQSLNADEIKAMGINISTVKQLYEEFAIANKLYKDITEKIQPEISDDEARAVSVKTILVKTYSMTNQGTRIEFTDAQKEEAFDRILEAKMKIESGTDFDIVAADYNEDEESIYSFGRGVMPEKFEEAAFNLSTNEVSDIVQTEYGYHILKCVSSFDRDETDANKAGILKQIQQEEFNNIYNEYVKTLTTNLNAPLWESVEYKKGANVNTTDFFDVYDRYFAPNEE